MQPEIGAEEAREVLRFSLAAHLSSREPAGETEWAGVTARAILWDLDGVIVNSGRYHYEAYRWLLSGLERDLPEEYFFSELFGLRNHEILSRVLHDPTEADIKRLSDWKERKFRELVSEHVQPLPGARELLYHAHAAGLKQAIVSSTPRANIDLIAQSLGVSELLDTVVGEEDSERGKPDPQPFVVAAQRLAVTPQDCVVIEDAPEGIAAAKAADMRAIGLDTTRPAEKLRQADIVVRSLEDAAVWAFITHGSDA